MTPTTEHSDHHIQNDIWHNPTKFLLLNASIALVIQVIYCATCFLSWAGIVSMVPDYIFSFFVSMVLSWGGSRVEDFLDPRVSWVHSPVKRLFLTTFLYLAYAFVGCFIIVLIYSWWANRFPLDEVPWMGIFRFSLVPMYIALVFMAIFTTRSWLLEWRKSAIEAEQLRSEKLASQNQTLKDQLNPHFLFNSLNTLSNLVYEDPDRSAAFIQKLSRIYRYVLEVQHEELVSLVLELDFAENYLELQKIRFGENLNFRIEVSKPQGLFLPPLSLQLLLENAVKHNIASTDNPLFIHILQKDRELWISNTFQPRSSQNEPSTGVGLNNIRSRYSLLSKVQPEVVQSEHEFSVMLPLLKLEQ